VKPRATCLRCGENLVESARPCTFCIGERRDAAVRKLLAAAKSGGDIALAARADAILTLRSLGYTDAQVLHARAQAVDGHSVEEIVERLEGAGLGAVA
jgi:hypothetical protein